MRGALFLGGFVLVTGILRADLSVPIPLEKDSGVRMEVTSFLKTLPAKGYAPLEVTITNSSGAPRQWTFDFSSPGRGGRHVKMSMLSSATVTVENNATRTAPLLVPISPSLAEMPWAAGVEVGVRGYMAGADASTQTIGGNRSSSREGAFVALSTQSGTAIWSELENSMKSGSRSELNGSLFDADRLPEDWRALSGIDGLWLTISEFDKLSSPQRSALRIWAQMGGVLTICGATAIPDDFQNVYFGQVKADPQSPGVFDTKQAISNLSSRQGPFHQVTDTTKEFQDIKPNVPVLIGFVILFAIVVGPLNIFVFASAGHRHRLFWTTPLISIAASVLLAAFIFLQDGVGGYGRRSALVYVIPDEHQQILVQQQSSRTGPLFGSSFQTTDPVVISESIERSGQNRVLKNAGTSFSGDWFASRSVQTQNILSVIPGRGEITLLNSAASLDQAEAPTIVSSFSSPLGELVYVDSQARLWVGKDVHPGQKITLAQGRPAFKFPKDLAKNIPSRSGLGSFYAVTRDSAALLNTLASIRWSDEPVVYFGPVSTP